MASTLPHKILSYIGTFIKKEDRLACALVCKHWTEPFLNAYWEKLEIGSFGMDIDTVLSNREFLINTHRVWAVIFFKAYLDEYKRLLEFQRSFPGIRYVECCEHRSHVFPISDTLDWSLWQSLTHIDIKFGQESETVYLDNLFLKLSVLPCLVHLGLYKSKQPPFSWNDYESLHYHLPQLEHLKHNFPFKPITRDEIESIRAVGPAQTMTTVEFNDDFDTHWLFYFASKYPNLQNFILYRYIGPSNRNHIDCNPQDYQSDLQLLSTLDQFFPYLKKADTVLRNKNMYLPFIFFETLGHFGTKIEYVVLSYESLIKNNDMSRCIHPISESLKFLEIDFRDGCGTIPFVVCPRLVALYINGSRHTIIEVDAILDCFPALRSLSVKDANFYLSTNPHTHTPHHLQRLKIKDSKITNDALHHLSLCCNQLKHVTFIDIGYDGINEGNYHNGDSSEPGQLIFDMSMSNLDTFISAFTDTLLHGLKTLPKHYMIEQMETDNPILQTTQHLPQLNWYHVYCDRTNRKEKISKWELGRRDIEFGQRYFNDFGRRKKRGKGRKAIKEDECGFLIMIRMYKAGLSVAEISRRENIQEAILYKIIKRYYKTKSVEDQPRSGRPKLLIARDKWHLERIVRSDRRQTLGEITREMEERIDMPISKVTISKTLRSLDYNCCTVLAKSYMTQTDIAVR
ncbi:hypothetical protein CLU79DRAFT_838948 [Phycomyces nitens]|nr:hypothetical protein CLU79DRAFT_838948 [Phycomyces nitens]